VLRHVDDCAVWVADEETAESPVLVRERVDDLGTGDDGPIVDGVDGQAPVSLLRPLG
jgi:hypothetical protein